MSAAHTPTPWQMEKLRAPNGGNYYRVFGPDRWRGDDQPTVQVFGVASNDYDAHANAAHIVRCVNAHDALVAALREALGFAYAVHATKTPQFRQAAEDAAKVIESVRAALAKVEG